MSVLLGLLGLGCIGYGVTVMTLNSGTMFFAVWYALGAGLLGLRSRYAPGRGGS